MSFFKYIRDKVHLIIFYIFLMGFICSVICFSRSMKISLYDLNYLVIISTILFIIYLLIEFSFYKKYYSDIYKVIKEGDEDFIYALPKPRNNYENIINDLLKKQYFNYQDSISKLDKDKGENLEFITAWVHDVKVPISVMKLIFQTDADKPIEETFYSLNEEVDKINIAVEKVLYYTREKNFSNDYLISEVSLKNVCFDVIKTHSKEFIHRKVKIDISEVDIDTYTDKKWLSFIINQVVSNSLKYINKNGNIRIWGEVLKEETRLHIKDNGIGIKSEDMKRVFQKGFTGQNGRTIDKSTGFGLYLSKQLAKRLGHDITIESEEGSFTEVIIHFPKTSQYLDVAK